MEKPSLWVTFFLLCCWLTACVNTKNVIYFNNLSDSARVSLSKLPPPQPLIQVNDVLNVRLGGENEKSVAYINRFAGIGGDGAGSAIQSVVDVNGSIELPKVGRMKVEGFTRDSAKQLIQAAYSEYLVNPIVNLTFGNFRFTVLGEVKSPGYYSVQNEKINVLEAVAQAGDMTPYAKKSNVKIVRDINGEREVITLNFNDKAILNSPNYYLHRYDIIYVEPEKQRYFSENFGRTTGIIGAATSVVALLLVILRK